MKQKKRAIMLISVLLISVLTLMFSTAAISLSPGGLARSAADSSLTSADRAARSGLDWVRSRISQDPRWKATTTQNFSAPGLFVSEGDGQVTGWVAENSSWSRFRIRFNYQDGAANPAPESDDMNDPATTWSDFPYCSCNNLVGASSRPLPLAQGVLGVSTSSGPWTVPQLTIPSNTLVVSIEGASGRQVDLSGGQPRNFVGAYHKRVAQAVLHLGNNQPITDAAIMAAGNLLLASASPIALNATGGEPARLRTKSDLTIKGGITSSSGEVMHAGAQSVSGPVTGVTVKSEDSTGLYKIPASKLRVPSSPATLQAGTYLVTSTGTVNYVNMNYSDYVAASPQPAGSPVTLPTGMTIAGPNPSGPKFTISLNKDLTITPSGTVTGFALVPQGGAPQSAGYGGVEETLPPSTSTGTPTDYASYWFSPISTKPPLTPAAYTAWKNFADTHLTLINSNLSGTAISPYASTAVSYSEYDFPGSGTLKLPNTLPTSGNFYPWNSNTTNLTGALAAGGAEFDALKLAVPLPTTSTSTTSSSTTPPPTGLKPKDLELQMQGGASGVLVSNDGDITIGAQIQSNGSALVSKADIHLIGTSTDFSSSSGTQLGLNLYAQKNITIDAYDLSSSGAGTFHSVKLQGVVYAWNDVTVLAADSSGTSVGPFSLKGSLVAYGGDPAGASTAGTGNVTVSAGSVDITYDPSYVIGLAPSGPFSMEILSWHQF